MDQAYQNSDNLLLFKTRPMKQFFWQLIGSSKKNFLLTTKYTGRGEGGKNILKNW